MKYKLKDQHTFYNGRKLHRIEALKDIDTMNVLKGDLGGFVESENNLSQEGDCWIFHDAMVYHNARVYENASVFHDAKVFDDAKVFGKSIISDDANIFGSAQINKLSYVSGQAKVYDNAIVTDYSNIRSDAEVFGNAKIFHSHIEVGSKIFGNATLKNRSYIRESKISSNQTFKGIYLNNAQILHENQCSIIYLKFLDEYLYSYIKRNQITYTLNNTNYNSREFIAYIKNNSSPYYDHRRELLDIITLNEIKFKAEYNFLS
ncbi:glucosamine N-acyltransferase [Bacillus phage vB_BauM_KLEB27-3]|nr:glucosamine N-acyltransferase [Bacillus phage vB_BauM_KLEB27-3]